MHKRILIFVLTLSVLFFFVILSVGLSMTAPAGALNNLRSASLADARPFLTAWGPVLVLVVLFCAVGYKTFFGPARLGKEMICLRCHTSLFARTANCRGSGWIELILWLCVILAPIVFLLPALFYSIWRRSSPEKYRCPECGAKEIIPADTPAAQEKPQKSRPWVA